MEATRNLEFSASTLNRYTKANKLQQLPAYLQFKKQFEHSITPDKINIIKNVYQHGICGRNQHQQTVIVDRLGNIKIQGLFKSLEENELISYLNQRLIELAEKVLKEDEQVVWIIDLSGKIMQLGSKKILQALEKVVVNAVHFFPLMLHRLIFVNTPMLFDTIWVKLSPLIPKQTQEKIIMIGDQLDNIYQFAQPSILPDFLGGEVDQQTFLYGKQNNKQEQQSSDEEQVDFSSLKMALSGLKVGGNSIKSVSQTPLNTEADDK